jgi:Mg-chelatase subunit ChlD
VSTRPSNNSPLAVTVKIALSVAFVIAIFHWVASSPKPPAHGTPAVQRPAVATPAGPRINPIEKELARLPNVPAVEGVAVAVLMDVSGSMSEAVRGTSGAPAAKIEIARRSILDVLRKTDAFAKAHPEKRVFLGVYEFSSLGQGPTCRKVIPLQAPDLTAAEAAVARMRAGGNTPIGDAIITAKHDLDKTGFTHLHVLVVTDGENNQGYSPGDVVNAISRLDETRRASVYFIAFDVAAEKFNAVRENGGLVLSAANAQELQQTLDYVLAGKILAEQPAAPPKR